MKSVLIDTGPLVALINKRDQHHHFVVESLRADLELVSCEAVLSEAVFLTGRIRGGRDALLALVSEGGLRLAPLSAELPALVALMRRYGSVPMSLADACLVRLSELNPTVPVLTLDPDFRIYRRLGRHVIPVWMPA